MTELALMTFTDTPSRASSTACAWRSLCGAKRRLTPASAACRRISLRTAAADHGRPRVGPLITQNSGSAGSPRRSESQGRRSPSPKRPCQPHGGDRPFPDARAPIRAAGQGVLFAQRECLLDAEPTAPQHRDHRAEPPAVRIVAGVAHHRDNLLNGRRVGWVEHALVAGSTPCVKARERRRRAAAPSRIENGGDGHGFSSR